MESAPGRGQRLSLPENSRAEWLVTLVIFLVSCAYLQMFRDGSPYDPDEGVALEGAVRILHGQVLYRDFFSFMTPGSFYWMALIFKIFGTSILVARTQLIVYGGLFSSLTYLLARRISSHATSLLTTYLLLITMLPYRFEALHNWHSTLWALLALYAAVLLLQTKSVIWAFAVGTFTAWTFLFEQSKGGGLALGLFIAFACIAFARPGSGLRRPPVWLAAAGGFAWPFLVVIGYWARVGALGEMWNAWLWPLYHYTAANAAAYGTIFPSYWSWADVFRSASWPARGIVILVLSPTIVVSLFSVLALGTLVACLPAMVRGKELSETALFDFLFSAVAFGAGLSVAVKRPETVQFIFVAPLLYLMLAIILGPRPPVLSLTRRARARLIGFLLVSFTLFGSYFVKMALENRVVVVTRRGDLKASSPSAALEYLMQHTKGGDKVLIYPYAAHLYFLTDTHSPTRSDFLQPSVNTLEQFEEAVRAVKADRTPLVLFHLSYFTDLVPRSWPFTPPAALAKEPLNELLLSDYHPCGVIGGEGDRFVAFWRKDLPCPPNQTP